VKYTITCGGSFPSERRAPRPVTLIASSTASRGTDEANTPNETRSVNRLPATTSTSCVTPQDHPGWQPSTADDTPNKITLG
jgi:hypothetical protein